ncbi:SRPBCC family protein [Nonlabens antarcticus]|uniref:SRPBCC family protein n=1 Tax=Nonlabens antarcticus TaxID=392714 RepID=UPI0018913C2E|nr:SRPBCC family protein [Nonlabens antarcticus]
MNTKNLKPITVQTTIKSGIEKVWNFWIKPEHIVNWNFATDEWRCPKAENDMIPNGKFSWRMEAKDGSMGFDFAGVYEKVVPKELITYRLPDGRLVSIDFEENEDEVTIRETFDAEGTNTDEQQRAGWQAILENFKKYVEVDK